MAVSFVEPETWDLELRMVSVSSIDGHTADEHATWCQSALGALQKQLPVRRTDLTAITTDGAASATKVADDMKVPSVVCFRRGRLYCTHTVAPPAASPWRAHPDGTPRAATQSHGQPRSDARDGARRRRVQERKSEGIA